MPTDHTLRPQVVAGLGDQSGNLTGGVTALLFNELRSINTSVRENSNLQCVQFYSPILPCLNVRCRREAIEAILRLQSDNTRSTTPPSSPGPSRASQKTTRRTRTPVQTVRDRKLNQPSLRTRKRQGRIAERVALWKGDKDQTHVAQDVADDKDLVKLRVRHRHSNYSGRDVQRGVGAGQESTAEHVGDRRLEEFLRLIPLFNGGEDQGVRRGQVEVHSPELLRRFRPLLDEVQSQSGCSPRFPRPLLRQSRRRGVPQESYSQTSSDSGSGRTRAR